MNNQPTMSFDELKPSEYTLRLDAFIRSVGVNKSTSHLFFLGAGASVSSGVPSAENCIWEWKRKIFLTQHPGMEEQFSEISLVGIRQEIQRWFDRQQTFPDFGDPSEYGFYMEECFPIVDDRRVYFEDIIRLSEPHIGYHLLCLLAQMDLVRAVWSTNFDSLVARAATAMNVTPIEVSLDTQNRLPRLTRKGELVCVSLHGDFRYDQLKNTPMDFQEQEESLKTELIQQLRRNPTIVIGYSGRDKSVMDTFREAYSTSGIGSLYWCGYGDDDISPEIMDLISVARQSGYSAYYIPSEGFDDILLRITSHCCTGTWLEEAKRLMASMKEKTPQTRAKFRVPEFNFHTVIKSNAFEIECPSEVLTFNLNDWPESKVWATIKKTTEKYPIVAVPHRKKILALGAINDVNNAFNNNIRGTIDRTPVNGYEISYEDGPVASLMKEALTKAITRQIGVSSDGRNEIWDSDIVERLFDENIELTIHESILIYLRRMGDRIYLVLKPSLRIQDESGQVSFSKIATDAKYRILGSQYNKQFNQIMEKWRKRLFPKKESSKSFLFPDESTSSFLFKVKTSPVFADIGSTNQSYPKNVPSGVNNLVRHQGIELLEPPLLFSNDTASRYVKDTHPIRGIVQNRPYDFALTQKGLTSLIKLGIISPLPEAQRLETYLQGVYQKQQPRRYDPEYLMEYPGFGQAYGINLTIPNINEPGWVTCLEPESMNPLAGSRELANHIIQAIETIMASYKPHAVLIFIPNRWWTLRGYSTENDRFDLHDFIKAYCVERGISTQFLEEKTLINEDQCSVWWWLSLALYVKSMRTPWVLESLATDTAFVGLGFSIDPTAPRGQHVVLGCSHIYSSRGEGLQFRLSKIENPTIRGRNAFMSEEDSRRLGETIRHLFYDSKSQLPDRVVIHKQTQFTQQEREGLCEGLSGVSHIEMLEIQIDNALRYVSSVWKGGRFDEDNYPVRRGTTMKLDDYTSLVWVHGSASALNPRMRYFQGRRRIPAPLVMKRYMGDSDLNVIAQELLGLSKMNWNTFDLYTKLPVTIHSSGEIARIGQLLQRFKPQSYDFRLFM